MTSEFRRNSTLIDLPFGAKAGWPCFQGVAPEQDRARFAFKKFNTFKKSFDLKDGFKMYAAKPHIPSKKKKPEKTESKRKRVKLQHPVIPRSKFQMMKLNLELRTILGSKS
jgi:hypothetical protein